MDLSGGFSFHESNSSVTDDQLESPKPWPQISNLQISDGSADDNNQDPKTSSALNSNVAKISVIEVSNPVKESSANKSEFKQPMPPITKVRRAKVPFEKGYSPMDWLKLTQTHKDLAGLKGRSNRRLISLDEVKKHKTEGDCWTVLKGCVYNISPYLKFHPGGVDMLMKAAGKDCTTLFNKYHAWVNAEFLMEKCLVGILDVPA